MQGPRQHTDGAAARDVHVAAVKIRSATLLLTGVSSKIVSGKIPGANDPTHRHWINIVGTTACDVDFARSYSRANNYLLLWQSRYMISERVVLQLILMLFMTTVSCITEFMFAKSDLVLLVSDSFLFL